MTLYANSNYSFNPWMVDIQPRMNEDEIPDTLMRSEDLIAAVAAQVPFPAEAGYTPRLGYENREPGIQDVFSIGLPTLMRDTATSQDSGMQGTLRPSLGQ